MHDNVGADDNMEDPARIPIRLFRAEKALRAIGNSLNALHEASSEISWLKQVCTELLLDTDFVMAWVGLAENTPDKHVQPIAWAGEKADYLDHVEISWGDNPQGQGPTGRATRSGQPAIMQDIHNNPEFAPWRQQAEARGYASSAALPIIYDGQSLGVLNIYSEHPGAFESSEVALLSEFAREVGLGITFLRSRASEARALELRSGSEHLFRSLIDTLPQFIFLKSVDFTFVICNQACARIMGLNSPLEIAGKRDEDFFSPEQVTRYRKDDIRVLEEGNTIDVEETFIFEGRQSTLQTVKTPMRDKAGKITGILGISWDISERKQLEQSLQDREQLLEDTASMAHIGGWEIDAGTGEGVWTAEVAHIHGLDPADNGSLAFRLDPYRAEARSKLEDAIKAARTSGLKFDLEAQLHNINGNTRWVRIIGHPIREHGAITRIRGAIQDITARKLDEIRLRNSRKLLQHIIDTVPVSIFWKNTKLEYLGCNRSFATDAGLEEPRQVIGKTDSDLAWKDQAELYRSEDRQVIESAKPRLNIVEPQTTPDGSTNWLRTSKVPLYDSENRVMGMLGVYSDITEMKLAEQELRQSEETFRSLFDNMLNGMAYCRMVYEAEKPVDFMYINVNNSFRQLTGLQDVEGRLVTEVIPGFRESDTALLELYSQVALGGESKRFEYYVKSLDMWFWLSVYSPQYGFFVAVFDVITERKKTEIELKHANRALKALSSVNRLIVHHTHEAGLLQDICRAIVELQDYPLAWVGLLDQDSASSLEIVASAGEDADTLKSVRIPVGSGISATEDADLQGRTVIHDNLADDPLYQALHLNPEEKEYTASISMPLLHADRVFGVMQVYTSNEQKFGMRETALLQEMAEDLAYGISNIRLKSAHVDALTENAQNLGKIKDNLKATIAAIASSIEARDPYTSGHQHRVAILAVAIARKMGLDENRIEGIQMGALIHDIGKLQIPAEILSKPTKLISIEYELIKQHPTVGYNILKQIDSPWPVAEIAWQHHEHFDGSGYPQGFKGEQITLEARIVAVADTVEAMSSHRPYRPALTIGSALEEIRQHRGTRYDPVVVDACLAIYEEGFELKS